jgi:uracil-DNA glycosylase family 4
MSPPITRILVGPAGPPSAQIAFIGEAPGATEAQKGQPFVGAAGQLFDKLLSTVGIVRSGTYITNVVKERPPSNDIKKFITVDRGRVKATPEYYEYERSLYAELKRCSANVLVPLGGTALFALTRKIGITHWRGSVIPAVAELNGRKVVPTIHPSAALREYLYTHLIRQDLVKVLRESEYPDFRYPQRTFHLNPSFAGAMMYLTTDMPRIIGFDIENPVKHIVCFSIAKSPYDAMCIPLVNGYGDSYFNPDQEAQIMLALAAVMTNHDILKIGHNIKHDAYMMFRDYGIVLEPIACTSIGCKMVLPDFPKKLAFACSIFTEIPYYKYMGGKAGGIAEGYDK